MPAQPVYFVSPGQWRAWLDDHATTASELIVGFWKVGTGRPSMTWAQSVDEALCHGWIDGVRRRIDDASYSIRFTPRKPGSTWSAVNVARVAELEQQGRLTENGQAAFERRREDRTGTYSHEREQPAELTDEQRRTLRADPAAWAHWQGATPTYRRVCAHWIVSAKRPETRARRFAQLLEDSSAGRNVPSQRWG